MAQGGKGTGLGLALVRHIVKVGTDHRRTMVYSLCLQLSGGRLGVKSKLGCGSTFWVELRQS